MYKNRLYNICEVMLLTFESGLNNWQKLFNIVYLLDLKSIECMSYQYYGLDLSITDFIKLISHVGVIYEN
jgi:hypothetical protein